MLDAPQTRPPKPRRAGANPLDQVIDKLNAAPGRAPEFTALRGRRPERRSLFVDLCRTWASRFGLDAARQAQRPPFTWRDHELMCRTMLSCLDLEDAIGRAADFCCAIQPRGARLSLTRRGGAALFGMDTLAGAPSLANCMTEVFGLLSFQRVFGWLIGEPLAVRVVLLAARNRDHAAPFTDLFGAPVIANQACSALEFDAGQLSRAIVRNAAELKDFLAYPLLQPEPDAVPVKISQRVGAYLELALAEGRGAPTFDRIALHLGVSEATLRRRLREEATSYQVLKEQSQRRLAEYHLRHTDRPVAEIAQRLGFSNAASLRRAFHRWTGTTPKALRR